MICYNCADAGDANKNGQTDLAAFLHAMCKYPISCTCLHRTGNWLILAGDIRSAGVS